MEIKIRIEKRKVYVFSLLLLLFFLSFYLRGIVVGSKLSYPKILAIDPYLFLRLGEYIVNDKWEIFEHDIFIGYGTIENGVNHWGSHIVTILTYPLLYFIVKFIIPSVSFYNVAIYLPAFLSSLYVFLIYGIMREMKKDRKQSIFAAFILITIPAIMYRTSAGFIEKEPIAGIFMLLFFYFFFKAVNTNFDISKIFENKRGFLKLSIFSFLSSLSIILMAGAWGGYRIPIIIVGTWILISILIEKNIKKVFSGFIMFYFFFILISFLKLHSTFPSLHEENVLLLHIVITILLIYKIFYKFNLIKKKDMKFLVPSIYLFSIFSIMIAAYVFIDFGEWINFQIARIYRPITLGVIPSTVAESQTAENFFSTAPMQFGTGYAILAFKLNDILRLLSPIYFVYVFFILFLLDIIVRRKVNIYDIFLLSFFLWGAIAAMGAVRLSYFTSFPIAMIASISFLRILRFFQNLMSKTGNERIVRYTKLFISLLVFLFISLNFASAFVMANSINSSLTNDWYQAFLWIRENTNKSDIILEWWDFGYWFQYVAKRRTIVDGGYHGRNPLQRIAKFYTEPLNNESLKLLKEFSVDYVMVSPDLIGKYGAMSKIANWGARIDTLPVFQLQERKQIANKFLLRYSWAGQDILLAYSILTLDNRTGIGNITAVVKTPLGYIDVKYIAFGDEIIESKKENTIPAMIYFAGNALIFIPDTARDSAFVRLYFFDGIDLHRNGFIDGYEKYFTKVYDNMGMKIYKVNYENFPENIKNIETRYETKKSDMLFKKFKNLIYGE